MESIYVKLSELVELCEPVSYKLEDGTLVWVKPIHVAMSVPVEGGGELHLVTGKVLRYVS